MRNSPEKIPADRYQAIFEAFHHGILISDASHKIKFINAAALSMFGYKSDELYGEPLTLLMASRFKAKHNIQVDEFIESSGLSRVMEKRSIIYGQRKDGTEFPTEISILKIKTGNNFEVVAIIRDVSETSKLIEDLKNIARTDALTKINNRRSGELELIDELDRSNRYNHKLSLVMFDIDHFKQVNDVYGHEMGDKVLFSIANDVTSLIRDVDIFSRWGGEEFVLILPETSAKMAFETTERLRISISELKFPWMKKGEKVTASFGVTESQRNETDHHAIIIRADKAMYLAKDSGRNCVR